MTEELDKLLNMITTEMQQFGMPVFQDRFPAMSVIQIIKDSGYEIWDKDGVRLI